MKLPIEKSRTIGAKDKQKRKQRIKKETFDLQNADRAFNVNSITDIFPKEKLTKNDILITKIEPNMINKYTYSGIDINDPKIQSGWRVTGKNKDGEEISFIDEKSNPKNKIGQIGFARYLGNRHEFETYNHYNSPLTRKSTNKLPIEKSKGPWKKGKKDLLDRLSSINKKLHHLTPGTSEARQAIAEKRSYEQRLKKIENNLNQGTKSSYKQIKNETKEDNKIEFPKEEFNVPSFMNPPKKKLPKKI